MKRAQQGMVVLASVTLIVMMAVLVQLYYGSASRGRGQLSARLGEDLVFAREALIDYSVNYPSHYSERSAGPGHLPCPDVNGNGSPSLSCSGNAMGFLPVDFKAGGKKNLSFLERQAITSQSIVYVISSAFRYNPAPTGAPNHATIVNSGTQGELQLDEEQGIIALLIAPGPALEGQNRAQDFVLSDYLEGENADGDHVFAHGQGNDRIIALRREHLMPLVERRVLATAHESMQRYFHEHARLPWLAPTDVDTVGGDSFCVPCQQTGWLASERFYHKAVWPASSEQRCENEERVVFQPTPELPAWFVSNYWHRLVWLHMRSEGVDPLCPVSVDPVVDELPVNALVVSVGTALQEPAHGLGPQVRGPAADLAQYLDRALWLDGSGQYPSGTHSAGVDDQWSVLP